MGNYGPKEMAASFRTVRKNTIQIAEDIPEDKYDFVGAPDTMSVAATLKHLVYAPRLYQDIHAGTGATTMVGFDFPAALGRLRAAEEVPRTKEEIVGLLKAEGESFAGWLESRSPEYLAETFTDGTGTQRSRLESLLSPKEHEMHHRGQLMLMERMLGIVPHVTRARQQRTPVAKPAT